MTKRSFLAPAIVLTVAVLSGGWFLQQGVGQEQNVYFQARLFQEVVDRVAGQYVDEVDRETLYQSAIEGMLEQLDDPHTAFIDPTQYENFRIETTGDYGGVGLEIVERDGWVTVVSPIPGTPGDRAGIRPGDQFVEIDGRSAEGWDTSDAVEVLRGRPGTSVDVMMRRAGVEEPIPFTLTRAEIHLNAVPFATRLEGDVLYVPLTLFRETATAEIRDAIEAAGTGTVAGVVLDLRSNLGGLLEEGIGVSDLFLPAGSEVVETRGRAVGQDETYGAGAADLLEGVPVVVLVNSASASAAEIVAGALQDHDRALVIGTPTFGKGSVQTLFQLTGGNVLRLTTARWYTPVGRSIQKDDDEPAGPITGALSVDGELVVRPDLGDRPAFRSMGGRTLLGGGGIVPDLIVLPDTLGSSEQRAVQVLYRQAGLLNRAVFDHAVSYLQEHPGMSRPPRLTQAELDGFIASLPDLGVDSDPRIAREASAFLRRELEREIALQGWGDEGEFSAVRGQDAQLRVALEMLREASTPADLFRLAEARPEALPVTAAVGAGPP